MELLPVLLFRWSNHHFDKMPELYNMIFADAVNRQTLLTQIGELRRTWLEWDHRVKPLADEWLDKLEPKIILTTAAEPPFGDTTYSRNAATADSYTSEFGVITDTIKNYIQGRNTSLANEAP